MSVHADPAAHGHRFGAVVVTVDLVAGDCMIRAPQPCKGPVSNPDAVAEARLQARGFRSYIDGEWLISRAVHSLDSGGYRTAITAEQV